MEILSGIGILPEIRISVEPHPDQLVHKKPHFALIQLNFRVMVKLCTIKDHNGNRYEKGFWCVKLTCLLYEIAWKFSAAREAFCVLLERLATFFHP